MLGSGAVGKSKHS